MSKKKYEIQLFDNKQVTADQIKTAAWQTLSMASKAAYQNDFDKFFQFIKKPVKNITPHDVLKFLDHLEKEGYKNNTINRKIASLSKMFRVMVLAGEIKTNPVSLLKEFKTITRPTPNTIKVYITIDEIRKALKQSKKFSIQIQKITLMIKMLATSGLRVSEMLNIKKSDITEYDTTNKIIKILGKGKKERYIFIDNSFLDEIYSYYPVSDESEYLFHTHSGNIYDRKYIWKEIKYYFKTTINKDVHPHMLRHFYATHKINVEKQDIKAVSKFLGHSDVSTTLNFYLDTALDEKNSKIKL